MERTGLHLAPALALAIGLCTVAAPAAAHDQGEPYDRVDLQVTADTSVDNDTLVIVLYAEAQEQLQRDASDQVNDAVRWALARAGQVSGVDARTLGYRSNPVYRNQSLTGWRVRQSLRLESGNSDALSALAGELQSRLAIESVAYDATPAARAAAEDQVIAAAIAGFQARARLVAEHLGRTGYRIVRLSVSTHGQPPGPVPMRMAAMAADAGQGAAPALEGGTQQISVTVSGTIELES